MKELIYNLFFTLGRIFSFCEKLHVLCSCVSSCYYRFYSGLKSRMFSSFGKKSLLTPYKILAGAEYIKIGDNVRIGKGITLTAWTTTEDGKNNKICIENGTRIGENAHITCINNIYIGENVLTGRNILITDHAHGLSEDCLQNIPPIKRKLLSKGSVKIGNGVWIGDNVCVLPGVNVGDFSIIGANTVVSKDVPKYSVVVGSPSRVYKIKNKNLE